MDYDNIFDATLRTKFYNKFLQLIGSASITESFISTGIHHMVKTDDTNLK